MLLCLEGRICLFNVEKRAFLSKTKTFLSDPKLLNSSVYIFFLPQFHGIQLVVAILFHRCNSCTDSGEAKVKSHASSETQLLLDTMPAQPGLTCWTKHRTPGDRVSLQCPPQELLECDGTRPSLLATPSHNPDDAGPIVHRPMGGGQKPGSLVAQL